MKKFLTLIFLLVTAPSYAFGLWDGMGFSTGGAPAPVWFNAPLTSSLTMVKGTALTHTRASTANITDNTGALVNVATNSPSFPGLRAVSNLLKYSNDFSNAAWTKEGGTSSVLKTATDPYGVSNNAWVMSGNTNVSQHDVYQDIVATPEPHTLSAHVKAGTLSWAYLSLGLAGQGKFAYFDLATGVVGSKDAALTSSNIVPLGGGWYEISITRTLTNATYYPVVAQTNAEGNALTYAGTTADNIVIYEAQLNRSASSSEHISTTSTPVTKFFTTDSGGTPITGTTGLLSEPAATNIFSNPLAPATQSVTVTAVQHVLSFYGTGTVTLTGTSTAGPLVGTGANNRVKLAFTPTAGSLTLTLSGSVTSPQLEIGPMGQGTSPALSAGATTTRAATVITGTPSPSTTLTTAGSKKITGQVTFNGYASGNSYDLWGSYVDASNYTAILYDGAASFTLRKRVAGTNYDATATITAPTLGTTYSFTGIVNADNTTSISWNNGTPATQSNTLAPQFKSNGTFEIGSLNGVSNAYANFMNVKVTK